MNIKQIVTRHLKKNGYDGLVHIGLDGEEECGCGLDGLCPCDNPDATGCVPAYKWLIGRDISYTVDKRLREK